MGKELTRKQRAFVEAYLTTWNATEAARQIGYKHPNMAGPRLILKDSIKGAVEKRIAEKAMGADEVLSRLADQARANVRDFIRLDPAGTFIHLDDEALRLRGHLVKKVTTSEGKTNSVGIEMYDAQAALVHLSKLLGMVVDRSDITSGGEKIIVTLKEEDG